MTIGVALAFAVVVAWFPKGYAAWRYPLHQIDAPAHYYFIRRILDEGVGAATHLWPNDAYYPPLFHLLAAGLVAVSRLFGCGVTIYTAFNVVWIAGAGLVWPAAMQLLASYWTCRGLRDARAGRAGRGEPHDASVVPAPAGAMVPCALTFPCTMALVVPLLSVASASHPFQMLASGPLVAYGLAFSLLPFWLYATLRLFDAIAARAPRAELVRWIAWTVATGALTLFAHPRMAFTWLLFIGPFLLLRLPWRLILAAAAACVLGAGAFFAYMVTHYKSGRYFNPGDWFHTFVPNRTVPDALRVFVTDNIDGPAGIAMAVMIIASLAVAIATVVGSSIVGRRVPAEMNGGAVADYSATSDRALHRDAVSVLLVVALFALLYVCSTALTGWFPNIVAAAWYRAETRPLTMIPLAVVTLLVFAASALHATAGRRMGKGISDATAGAAESDDTSVSADPADSAASSASFRVAPTRRMSCSRTLSAVLVAAIAALAVGAQFGGVYYEPDGPLIGWGNSTRARLASDVYANMMLTDNQPDEQLTDTKYTILADVARTIEPGAAVISDPLNGSMYGTAAFGMNMLYPIYNPMAEKNGAIFGAVERAFDSGDRTSLLDTVCPIEPDRPEYFLVMGGQAPSLKMFTFRQQYDPFHREDLIAQYVADGTLVKVRDYADRADYAKGWALYRFGCAR
ncbi:hypothetical protein JS528_06765 [Bifidobacterium sp. MA2]|uniref:Transmembrane protein alanine and leucine rich n=2 Tax=Bifidobacterium santillanense TaxID=2809028 RepID=A0ABS5UQ96_9BIFI|nr:hypothetical protein [Bifidobacterium santillanense]